MRYASLRKAPCRSLTVSSALATVSAIMMGIFLTSSLHFRPTLFPPPYVTCDASSARSFRPAASCRSAVRALSTSMSGGLPSCVRGLHMNVGGIPLVPYLTRLVSVAIQSSISALSASSLCRVSSPSAAVVRLPFAAASSATCAISRSSSYVG